MPSSSRAVSAPLTLRPPSLLSCTAQLTDRSSLPFFLFPVVQIAHLRSERDILRGLDHPLLVRMLACFQDEQCVYLVMEYVPGGPHKEEQGVGGQGLGRGWVSCGIVLAKHGSSA